MNLPLMNLALTNNALMNSEAYVLANREGHDVRSCHLAAKKRLALAAGVSSRLFSQDLVRQQLSHAANRENLFSPVRFLDCEPTMNPDLWKFQPSPRIKPVIAGDTTYGVSLLTGTISGSNFAIP